MHRFLVILSLICSQWTIASAKDLPTIEEKTADLTRHSGFFAYYWDPDEGKIWIEIARVGEEFIYIHGLASGLGSNPVGLDRGQLGNTRLVAFQRFGPQVLLVQSSQRFRADTDNPEERQAVEDSFASSVLWGAKIAAVSGERLLFDGTDFLLRDVHDVVGRLKQTGQGDFRLDRSRSTFYPQGSKAFPDNTELEVLLTFTSDRPGPLVAQTAPTGEAVSLRQHHSFVRLSELGYQPRKFDPRSGGIPGFYSDYAAPLDESLVKRFVIRHRLKKKDPTAQVSEAVDPIVYYVDRGAPEPIKSALIEGASWWNQAFEAAGYRDAFQVKIMPEDAHPLDVRYNVIQWVHRSTRGWSYGSSVVDPRTGEILKGHVTLGSLRVRQDRMIFEGVLPRFGAAASAACGLTIPPLGEFLAALDPDASAVDVALARIRQLSAHEVGHTLGFAHNFAASTFGRASVMDYPAPLVRLENGEVDLTLAYDDKIGEWDKVSVRYSYQDFPPEVDQESALDAIIQESLAQGLYFITDADARPQGAAHPMANLWDNGADPVEELERMMEVRKRALETFGLRNIKEGSPLAELEETLVPVYLLHRYQVEAAAKTVGGVTYRYALRGDGQNPQQIVSAADQRRALSVLLRTISPEELSLPSEFMKLIPPRPYGYGQGEDFPSRMAMIFDPVAIAETAADITISPLLQHERAARTIEFNARDQSYPSFEEVVDTLIDRTWRASPPTDPHMAEVARSIENLVVDRLIQLASNQRAAPAVRAVATSGLRNIVAGLTSPESPDESHFAETEARINRFLNRPWDPEEQPAFLEPPPGSPIGRP